MKVAVVFIAVAVVGAFAQSAESDGPPTFVCDSTNAFVCSMKELAHNVKYHASKLGNNLKDVGTAVLNSALDQGKDLLANGAQAILGTVLEHMTKEGLVGKREVTESFFDRVKGHFSNGVQLLKEAKQAVHSAFEKAVSKLTGMMGDMSKLKGVEADADKEIDATVEEFDKKGKMGFAAMAKAIAGKLQSIYQEGMAKIKAMFGKKVEERAILGFDSLSDAWETAKGHFSNLAGTLSDAFKPHIDTLKSSVSELADKAKEHAGNLAAAATDSFNQLKDKLSTHVDALKGHAATLGTHATNALNALKEAVSSIALQTLSNTKDTLNDAIKTGQDAAGVVSNHVNDALKPSN